MNNFELDVNPLGRGAFGVTYRTKKISDETQVYIKISNDIKNPAERECYEKEITFLAKMNHENIIQYISYFWNGNRICVEMEYADGGTSKIITKPFMPESEILKYFVQVVEAVKYIHSQNMVHRDLKPDNIFLMKNGHVEFGDFGVSRLVEIKKQKCQSEAHLYLWLLNF
jgi:NIMA (never in mitosis gene a)-related kinase